MRFHHSQLDHRDGRTDQQTDGRKDGQMDGRTKLLIEMRGRI